MKLIFVRHGQAAPYCDDDAGRDLTDFGRMQAGQSADALVAQYQLDLIIASPYNRADQTAKILAKVADGAGQSPTFVTLSSITPDDDPAIGLDDIDRIIQDKFGEQTDDKCIAIVCHMPIVAYLVAKLDGLSPASFELAEYRVLTMPVIADGLAQCVASFVPNQP